MTGGLGVAGPVVRRPTRFHEDQRGWLLGKEAVKSLTSQSMSLSYLPGVFRDGDLKYRLRHVDRDRRTIHVGSSFRVMWTQGDSGTSMPFESREESIPSLQRTTGAHCSLVAAERGRPLGMACITNRRILSQY